MGIICLALASALDDLGSPAHYLFREPSMIQEHARLDYVDVLRLEGATHWYRDAVDHRVFPARVISRWADGFAAVEYLRGNVICLDARSEPRSGAMGGHWPMDDPTLSASGLAGRLERIEGWIASSPDPGGPAVIIDGPVGDFLVACNSLGERDKANALGYLRGLIGGLKAAGPDPKRIDLSATQAKLLGALLDAWEAAP